MISQSILREGESENDSGGWEWWEGGIEISTVVSGFCRDLSVFLVWTVLLLLLSIRGEGRSRLFGSFSNVFGKSDIFWTFLRRSSLSLSISALTIRSVRYLSHTHSLHPSTPVSLSFHPHIPQPPMEGLEVWGRRDGALTDMSKRR